MRVLFIQQVVVMPSFYFFPGSWKTFFYMKKYENIKNSEFREENAFFFW